VLDVRAPVERARSRVGGARALSFATPMASVVYLVRDLIFVAKIREAAEQLGVGVERAVDAEALALGARGARLVIVDLRLPEAEEALARVAADPAAAGARTVGFVDHENVAAMEAARARGCGTVVSKRKFSSELPALLGACR
jgi:CheY-like chemotaxis protein